MNFLKVKHVALAATLQMVLRPYRFIRDDIDAGPGDVVVTTTSDTSPAACRLLAERGVRVVVLTSGASSRESPAYGAAFRYLEMTAGTAALVESVAAASAQRYPARS